MAFLRLFRFCYWLKNVLVFLPALVIGRADLIFGDPEFSLLYTFLSFSLIASAGYIFNDLADFESDRQHPIKKKYKPIAIGSVNKQSASFWLAVTLMGGIVLTRKYLSDEVLMWEMVYFAMGVAYSLGLKRIPYLGLAFVSLGAIFRVLAGAAALDTPAATYLLVIAAGINLAINFGLHAHNQKKLKALNL